MELWRYLEKDSLESENKWGNQFQSLLLELLYEQMWKNKEST